MRLSGIRTPASGSETRRESVTALDGETEIKRDDSFVSLVVLEGSVTAEYEGGSLSAPKGGSIFIPAGLKVKISGKAEILSSRV